jgi:CheY-like chemotaxis protein
VSAPSQTHKLIAVLEDNAERTRVMSQWLCDRLYMYDHLVTDDPHEFIDRVRLRYDDVLVVSLDHDLYDRPDHTLDLTGMIAADFLTTLTPRFPVLIHSSNQRDAAVMRDKLEGGGWFVAQVTPFDDTNWIGLDWYPTLKRALRKFAKSAPVPSHDPLD